MKAFLVGKTERELVDRPIPEPGAGELLVKGERAVGAPLGRGGLAQTAGSSRSRES